MPIKIIETEKEGHRKGKSKDPAKRYQGQKSDLYGTVTSKSRGQRQKEYMEKHGQRPARRKRLGVSDKYEEVRKKLKPTGTLSFSKMREPTKSPLRTPKIRQAQGGRPTARGLSGLGKAAKPRARQQRPTASTDPRKQKKKKIKRNY